VSPCDAEYERGERHEQHPPQPGERHPPPRQHRPDATQRHQLYVQWLNARAGDPDAGVIGAAVLAAQEVDRDTAQAASTATERAE
jgi:hypothetical protein